MEKPTEFTQAIADELCEKIAQGNSLRSICRAEHLPSTRTVFTWLQINENFSAQYAIAREAQADKLSEEE